MEIIRPGGQIAFIVTFFLLLPLMSVHIMCILFAFHAMLLVSLRLGNLGKVQKKVNEINERKTMELNTTYEFSYRIKIAILFISFFFHQFFYL